MGAGCQPARRIVGHQRWGLTPRFRLGLRVADTLPRARSGRVLSVKGVTGVAVAEDDPSEEAELKAIADADAIEGLEAIRWPDGKAPGGKG